MTVETVEKSMMVLFTDQNGRTHNALVTAVHGFTSKEEQDEFYRKHYEDNKNNEKSLGRPNPTEEWLESTLKLPWKAPSLNVVYVSADPTQTDSYGSQIARATSVVHKSNQSAAGMFWQHCGE